MKYPQIIAAERHNIRDEFVILGREDDRLDGFFTRRAMPDGNQYFGNYRMTLPEAVEDFEARKNT